LTLKYSSPRGDPALPIVAGYNQGTVIFDCEDIAHICKQGATVGRFSLWGLGFDSVVSTITRVPNSDPLLCRNHFSDIFRTKSTG